MTYQEIANRIDASKEVEAAQFTATWENGNEPDGSTEVTIYVAGSDDTGYILICREEVYSGGEIDDAGDKVYPTKEAAILAAERYASKANA